MSTTGQRPLEELRITPTEARPAPYCGETANGTPAEGGLHVPPRSARRAVRSVPACGRPLGRAAGRPVRPRGPGAGRDGAPQRRKPAPAQSDRAMPRAPGLRERPGRGFSGMIGEADLAPGRATLLELPRRRPSRTARPSAGGSARASRRTRPAAQSLRRDREHARALRATELDQAAPAARTARFRRRTTSTARQSAANRA